jgi:hypothetical protein
MSATENEVSPRFYLVLDVDTVESGPTKVYWSTIGEFWTPFKSYATVYDHQTPAPLGYGMRWEEVK